MKVVIIDNYDSFTFNLFQMVQPLVSEPVTVVRNDKITFDELLAKHPDRIILSPGPGHPANDSDFGICKDVIVRHDKIGCPVLGVCLGHQGLVHHLGGRVIGAPVIIHGKTSLIKVEPDNINAKTSLNKVEPDVRGLFAGMPDTFEAMRYHSLVAAEEQFPGHLKVTARDSQNGLIMAIEHKTKPLYGVQFHPESIGTPLGGRILENFLQRC